MKWTDEQQRAIDIRNCNVLVSAAAGSGKTAVLTERIRKLIMEDGISVENMLIVTFSNAAAVEMKEKIIKALNSAANEEMFELSAEKVNFLRRQISLAHTADISTFHHFAMNVIRKYFYKADVEPGFLICDEARRDILIAEVLDNLIEDRFENDSEKFKDFMRRRADVRSNSSVHTLILEVYSFIMSQIGRAHV